MDNGIPSATICALRFSQKFVEFRNVTEQFNSFFFLLCLFPFFRPRCIVLNTGEETKA